MVRYFFNIFLCFKKYYLDSVEFVDFRYKKWLPDMNLENKRHDTKTTYQVEIRYANNTNETFTFHGPRGKWIF